MKYATSIEGKRYEISERMMKSIDLYLEHGLQPGSFLTSIISNDLFKSVAFADSECLENIPAYVYYFYNEAIGSCWGSKEKMELYMKSRQKLNAESGNLQND